MVRSFRSWYDTILYQMVTFPMPPNNSMMLWSIAGHGTTDAFFHPPVVLMIGYSSTLFNWGGITTPLFGASSVFHLSKDFGTLTGSLCFHIAFSMLASYTSYQCALKWMGRFLMFVHTPLHLQRCFFLNPLSACAAAMSSVGFCALHHIGVLPKVYSFSEAIQRVIIVHALLDAFKNRQLSKTHGILTTDELHVFDTLLRGVQKSLSYPRCLEAS